MINRIWAKFELERLAAMWRDGKPPGEIAATLRRTLGAVLNKARETKLIVPVVYHKQGKQAVVAAREQMARRVPQGVQGAYLARKAANDVEVGQSEPAPTGSTNKRYLCALLHFNEKRLEQAKRRLGVWSDMDERDLAGEIAGFVASIAAVKQALAAIQHRPAT